MTFPEQAQRTTINTQNLGTKFRSRVLNYGIGSLVLLGEIECLSFLQVDFCTMAIVG